MNCACEDFGAGRAQSFHQDAARDLTSGWTVREHKTFPTTRTARFRTVCSVALAVLALASIAFAADSVQTASGNVRGIMVRQGVTAFLGIPFAQPPVGDLRWRAPQPVKPWTGIRPAVDFGPRCMQAKVTTDIVTRSPRMSEDCLYLNVWTTSPGVNEKLPVLVYIYGGGFQAGDGSERRYDGAALAEKGMVVVTFNYRLGVFGLLALPELTRESPHHASGNYGLLDQLAVLQWVQRNIAAFGGDPQRVTIAGQSAGSMSVSAQMASPLTKGLIAGAIGESGSVILGPFSLPSLAEAEQSGLAFERSAGAQSLAALRRLSAFKLQDLSRQPVPSRGVGSARRLRFMPDVDGYFFPKPPTEIYAAGGQDHVPLMAGSNAEENGYNGIIGPEAPTMQNYKAALQTLFHQNADQAFLVYPASGDGAPVMDAAQILASDYFGGYSTWKWMELASKTGGQSTYYYYYSHPRPSHTPESMAKFKGWWTYVWHGQKYPRPMPRGAVHSAEIEYALGNLPGNHIYEWTAQDYEVSKIIQGFFVNFIKTGNPNGPGLPQWPTFADGQRMIINVSSHAEPDEATKRYEFLERTLFK